MTENSAMDSLSSQAGISGMGSITDESTGASAILDPDLNQARLGYNKYIHRIYFYQRQSVLVLTVGIIFILLIVLTIFFMDSIMVFFITVKFKGFNRNFRMIFIVVKLIPQTRALASSASFARPVDRPQNCTC